MAENDQVPGQQPSSTVTSETRFGVQRIYLKDASLEAPDSPEAFRRAYNPQVSFSINSRSKKLDGSGSMYEVVLRLTADVKQDNKTSFLVEVQQAGIFEVAGLEGERLEQVLSITCPTVLFPYGREAIDSLVTKASFPPLMLAPINFEAVYLSAKKKQAESAAASAGGQLN
jgi:preprotein translocase subunit SecB